MGEGPDLDERLGLDQPISRRDFLDGVLLTSADLFLAGSCPFPLGAQGTDEISSGWTDIPARATSEPLPAIPKQ